MIISLILAMISGTVFANNMTFVKYHVQAVDNPSDVKSISFGQQSDLFSFAQKKWEVGYFVDRRPGARSSAYGFVGVGVEPTAGSLYVNFFQSVGGISSPDSYLGGRFQFMEEVGIGIKDKEKKTSVGLLYKHISSAGLNRPNKGRDFIGIQVSIPWP